MKLSTVVLTTLLATGTLLGAERRIPIPYQTIQQAIDACANGDVVIVTPGTYRGTNNRDIDFKGKQITVRSEDPGNPAVVSATIIDCGATASDRHRGFYFRRNENRQSVLTGLTIINGRAPAEDSENGLGGGVYVSSTSEPTISNCIIKRNTAGSGGGIYAKGRARITRCTITENTANFSRGAGIGLEADVEVTECLISNNNTAYAIGGGIACYGYQPRISNCSIVGNSASYGGGLLLTVNSRPRIMGCLIHANVANGDGYPDAMGGGLYCVTANPQIFNTSIVGNRITKNGRGGGVHVDNATDVFLNSSIIWANSAQLGPQASVGSSGAITITTCIVEAGQASVYMQAGGSLLWAHNLESDPMFQSLLGLDGLLSTWADNDLRVSPGSPCIDAGDNSGVTSFLTTDLDGRPRFLDDLGTPDSGSGVPPIIDIGAYEFGATSPPPLDTDSDGVPDKSDLCPNTITGIQVDTSGCPTPVPGDFDRDGDVDQEDFGVFQRCLSGPGIPADPNCR